MQSRALASLSSCNSNSNDNFGKSGKCINEFDVEYAERLKSKDAINSFQKEQYSAV